MNLYYLTKSTISKNNNYEYEKNRKKQIFNYLSKSGERDNNCEDVFFYLPNTQKKNPKTLMIFNLDITIDSISCIIEHLEKKFYNKISLYHSDGGHVLPAIYLGNYLRENKISLNIKSSCLSSCTYLVFKTETTICKKEKKTMKIEKGKILDVAEIGIHQETIVFSNLFLKYFLIKSFYYDLNEVSRDEELRVDSEYIEEIKRRISPEDMYIFNKKELIQKKIIKEIIDC